MFVIFAALNCAQTATAVSISDFGMKGDYYAASYLAGSAITSSAGDLMFGKGLTKLSPLMGLASSTGGLATYFIAGKNWVPANINTFPVQVGAFVVLSALTGYLAERFLGSAYGDHVACIDAGTDKERHEKELSTLNQLAAAKGLVYSGLGLLTMWGIQQYTDKQ